MKTKLLLLLTFCAPLCTLAQGKVAFGNDSNHLIVIGVTRPADVGLGGGTATPGDPTGAIPASPLPNGLYLAASLYAGTTSTALTLQRTVLLTASYPGAWVAPGRMANQSVILSFPGGTVAWFDFIIHDPAEPDPFHPAFSPYSGRSGLFTAVPGTSIFYPGIMPGGAANSTFPDQNLVVNWVPEPSSLCLFTLGSWFALLFNHVRKR